MNLLLSIFVRVASLVNVHLFTHSIRRHFSVIIYNIDNLTKQPPAAVSCDCKAGSFSLCYKNKQGKNENVVALF